jgi:hypothetical protein
MKQVLHNQSVNLYRYLPSMQCACAVLYCPVCPVPLYRIFPHYLIIATIFGKKLLNIKCVCLCFLYNFFRKVSHSKKKWARYNIIKNVHHTRHQLHLHRPVSPLLIASSQVFQNASVNSIYISATIPAVLPLDLFYLNLLSFSLAGSIFGCSKISSFLLPSESLSGCYSENFYLDWCKLFL